MNIIPYTQGQRCSICLDDFKACSSIKLRVNDTTCDSEIYEFKMTGSTAALNFVSKP